MLNDGAPFSRIYLKVGRTDLRKGIDGLATIVKTQIHLDPFQKNVLFLFCGRSPTKIKGLLWEGDGFLLLHEVDYYSRKTPDEPYTSVPSKSFLNNSSSWY